MSVFDNQQLYLFSLNNCISSLLTIVFLLSVNIYFTSPIVWKLASGGRANKSSPKRKINLIKYVQLILYRHKDIEKSLIGKYHQRWRVPILLGKLVRLKYLVALKITLLRIKLRITLLKAIILRKLLILEYLVVLKITQLRIILSN